MFGIITFGSVARDIFGLTETGFRFAGLID